MKKITLSLLFALAGLISFAQDYNRLVLLSTQKKFEDAKQDIDKIVQDPKAQQKPETWLWKANIYSELFADSSLSSKYPDVDKEAYDALNKYRSMDTSLKLLKENGLRGLGILYSSSFNSGKKYFTESKWQQAFDNFKRAEELGEFVTKNGFSNNADKNSIDTFTVLYTGFAAQNNNKPADAIVYYEKLADRKIGTKEMADMYHYMLNHYSTQKNTEKFTKYLTLAKELYPDQNAKWSQIEMNNMNQTAGMDQIIGKYKQDDAAGKMTEDQYITYAQAFASPEKDQLSKLDSTQQVELKFTAADAFKKAFALNNNGIYAYNAGVLYYNVYSILEEKLYGLRGTSATLKAQREEVQKQQMPLADSAINWLEKGYTILKAKTNREKTESNSLNRAVDFLANLYAYKRDRSKGVNVKDVDKYDAKFKEYDNEHDKYKP